MLFLDYEVFYDDWLVVILDMVKQEEVVIINDRERLMEYHKEHENDIWVGFNIRRYDQYIHKAILMGINPYHVSNCMIEKDMSPWEITMDWNNIKMYVYDTMITQQYGLKHLEGFMGSSIQESSVDFTIQRKLTQKEIEEVIGYCRHDVEETVKVFLETKAEFDAHLSLIQAFKLPMRNISKTKAQLSAMILGADMKPHDDEFDITLPDTLRLDKYRYIADWYMDKSNRTYHKSRVNKLGRTVEEKNQLVVDVANVPHVFGWGGVHGALEKYTGDGIFVNSDVASLYPSLMIEYGFQSRNIAEKNKYREIRDTRLQLKAEKNPLQLPYKIVLNSTYGAMKDKYNNLYDPLMANNVCVAGQLLLLDLIEKVEHLGELIQSNTDGIMLKLPDMDTFEEYKRICKEWETRTRLDLEHDIYVGVRQKDVNNYMIIDAKGKCKTKGAYLKRLSKIDNNLPIVNRAVVEYLAKGTPIEDTINSSTSLMDFQIIGKISRKYLYGLYGSKVMHERVVRVFASNSKVAKGVQKVKKNPDGSLRYEKLAGSPERCFIENGDISNKPVPRCLDKDWYISLAKERVASIIGG